MKKTLFTTALAIALAIGGMTAFAQEEKPETSSDNTNFSKISFKDGVLSSTVAAPFRIIAGSASDFDLKAKLAAAATTTSGDKQFGYLLNGSEFVSLKNALTNANVIEVNDAKLASISLGNFNKGDTIEFGYGNPDSDFVATNVSLNVSSDPGYFTGYNSENFFQLDFSQDPFDGMIEVLVMGEPLPASTVSLLVALGAGAVFLLYHNRRRRIGAVEQA